MHIGCPGPTATNPWTYKSRSYLLLSYLTDIWKTIKRLDIWHTSRLKTNTSIAQVLDQPTTHLPGRPRFIPRPGPATTPPGHVSSGPIFCLHTRQISEKQSKVRDDTILEWKQTLQSSTHLTHHPPTRQGTKLQTLHIECPGPTTTPLDT